MYCFLFLFSISHLSSYALYSIHCTYVTAFDSVVMAISEAGGLNAIEELQNHPNQNIYQRAVKMLEVRKLLLLLFLLFILSMELELILELIPEENVELELNQS